MSTDHNVGGMFTFALVGLFAVLALLVAVVGVQAYQSVLDTNAHNNEVRASMSYIANKVRTGDAAGALHVTEVDGEKVLRLDSRYEGEEYQSYIYYYDGGLYEQTDIEAGDEFLPEDGDLLININRFDVDINPSGLIGLTVEMSDGQEHTVHMAVRSNMKGE